ncbi:MAG TPA: hypothetical protein VGL74_10345 [Terriglobales bacterium]|jgi:hypothetical protein
MNRQRFQLLTAATAMTLLFSASAWADLTGTIWQIQGNYQSAPTEATSAAFLSANGATQEGQFNTDQLNFLAGPTGRGDYGDLQDFLSNGGQTGINYTGTGWNELLDGSAGVFNGTPNQVTDFNTQTVSQNDMACYTGGNPGSGTDCYSTVINITGSITLQRGETYTINHDDGITLSINETQQDFASNNGNCGLGIPSCATADAGPVDGENSIFGVSGTGPVTVNFDLWYVGTNGNPESLTLTQNGNVVTFSTPEAGAISTLIAMLIGLAAFAGMFRKKLA